MYHILRFSLEKHVFESDFFRKFDYYFVYLHKVKAVFLLFCLLSDCKPLTKISKKVRINFKKFSPVDQKDKYREKVKQNKIYSMTESKKKNLARII